MQQQALEVVAFGEGQIDRMIGGALQALHNARRASRVERGAGGTATAIAAVRPIDIAGRSIDDGGAASAAAKAMQVVQASDSASATP